MPKKDLETSLQVLGTDYVDVLHLHGRDNPSMVPDEAIEGLEACKKAGKARFIGFSCHDVKNMVDFIIEKGKFDVIQITYSFPIGLTYRDRAIKKLHAVQSNAPTAFACRTGSSAPRSFWHKVESRLNPRPPAVRSQEAVSVQEELDGTLPFRSGFPVSR